MFIGHHAAAFAAKRIAPRTSLGLLMAAATLIDLVWPILLLTGVEHVRIAPGNTAFTPLDFYDYPWTHSLLAVCLWGLVFGGAYWLATRYARGAWVLAAAVVSHWVLDFITHRPDLPLYPGGPKVGLGMWQSVPLTLTFESFLFLGGLLLYARGTRPRDRIGRWSLLWFVVFLLAIYAANALGTAPPSVEAIGWLGLSAWLLPLWAWWFDRHREPAV